MNSTLERANKVDGSNRTLLERKLTNIMQVKIFHRNRKVIPTQCENGNGGCSHLCLLKPLGHSCACPTGIKLKVRTSKVRSLFSLWMIDIFLFCFTG